MDKATYRITLDTHRSGVQKTLYGFFAGDVLARKIAISLVGGSMPCKYDEVTAAVMYVTKPNGTTSYNACTVSDNTIFYDVLQTDTDTAGIVTMQFKVMSGETVLYAPEFALEVQASKNSDTPAEETPTYTALEEALLKTETVAANEQGRVDAEKKRAEEYEAMHREMQEIIAEADALLTAGGISEEKAQHLIDEATKDKVDKVEGQGLSTNDYSDTEKQQVATNKTNIENLKNGTTPAGDANKFGGKLPEYYAKKIEVDNIQTTSRATLSTAGWYRVAKLASAKIVGYGGDTCYLTINREVGANTNNETHELLFNATYNSPSFHSVFDNSKTQLITKVRSVKDTTANIHYLEVYYGGTSAYQTVFTVESKLSTLGTWQAITPTLTSETLDGVTVTTTYDIPANASPVATRAVGATGQFYRVFARMDNTKNNEPETVLISGGGNLAALDGLWAVSFYARPNSTHQFVVRELIPATGGSVKFGWYAEGNYRYFGMYTSNAYSSVPFITKLDGSSGGGVYNAEYGEFYNSATMPTGWAEVPTNKFATDADLANYLPLDGSKAIPNYLDIGNTSTSNPKTFTIKNALRHIHHQVNASGVYYLYDTTNGKNIIISTADGTNTFNGTATGNLPLTGGGEVRIQDYNGLAVTHVNGDAPYIRFKGVSGELGFLGLDHGTPTFKNGAQTANYTIFHSGNSAKVAIQETAPTDTTALWVDTANKVTKAYIDGAWTQVA